MLIGGFIGAFIGSIWYFVRAQMLMAQVEKHNHNALAVFTHGRAKFTPKPMSMIMLILPLTLLGAIIGYFAQFIQ